jgi:hypothetical protein
VRADRIDERTMWKCEVCSKEATPTVHQLRQVYCSRECVGKGYSIRLAGSNNPNYKDAATKSCMNCGASFASYTKTRKFCSHACYIGSKPKRVICEQIAFTFKFKSTKFKSTKVSVQKVREPKVRTPKPAPRLKELKCEQCTSVFHAYPSAERRYCTYKCFIDSGGAYRAGIAAVKAIMKYGAKKDANHKEIFDVMREHCPIFDLSAAGCGVPDGIAYINGGWILFDVKNPKTGYGKRGLNPVQLKWASKWAGFPIYLIYTIEEAEKFAQGSFDGLKVHIGQDKVAVDDGDSDVALIPRPASGTTVK